MDEKLYYLMNATAEELENLRSLLYSEVKTNELLALSMMMAGGLPKSLVIDVLKLYLQNRTAYTKVFSTGKMLIGVKSEIEELFKKFGYQMLVFGKSGDQIFENGRVAFDKLAAVGIGDFVNELARYFPVDFVFNSNLFSKKGLTNKIEAELINGRQELNLPKLKIKKVPAAINFFRYLKRVNFYDNEIEQLPLEFCDLIHLEELVLASNKIKNNTPVNYNINSLLMLDLSDNDLTFISEELVSLRRLKWLFLSKNSIKILPESMLRLKALQNIDLSFNEVKEIPSFIGEMYNLETLNFKGNQIQSVPVEMARLSRLKSVNLKNNPIANNHREKFKLKKLLPRYCELFI